MAAGKIVVAIDGPAGAGKSTVAQAVAEALGYVRVDTGALYRGVALVAKERGVDWTDGQAVAGVASSLKLSFRVGQNPMGEVAPLLCIDGVERDADLRTPEVAEGASVISKHPALRDALLDVQRRLGEAGGVVFEGRDIGTVVFPEAQAKVFLTASPEARADRRFKELQRRGVSADRDALLDAIRNRDARDSSRPVAPLKAADDAVVVDSTEMDFDTVVTRIVAIARDAMAQL